VPATVARSRVRDPPRASGRAVRQSSIASGSSTYHPSAPPRHLAGQKTLELGFDSPDSIGSLCLEAQRRADRAGAWPSTRPTPRPESRARCPRRAPAARAAASRRRARPGSRPARALAALVAVKNVKPRSWRLSAAHPRRGRPSRRRFAIVIASGSLDARGPAPPRDHSCEVASGSLQRQRSRAARGPRRARRANRRDLSSGARRRLRRRRRRAARARARRGDAYAPASSPASARRELDARSRVHGKFSNQFAWLGSGRSPLPPPAPLARPPAVEDRLRSPGALRPTRARVEPPASCPPWPLTSRKRRKP
jgi:hypothetical protein